MVVSNDVVHDSRVLKEARALRAAGHTVTFIGWDRTGREAASKVWDGFDIHLVRTEGLMRLAGKDLLRNPIWWRRAERIARSLAFDVVHCHDLDTLPIGIRLKEVAGTPIVYDAHEVFGYMIETDVPRPIVDYVFRMERRLAPRADSIISVNEAVKEYIDRVSGQDSVVVRNCHDLVIDAYRPPPGPPFTVIYLGTLHISRFILQAIDVVGEMPDVRLVLGGSKKLTPIVKERCSRHANTPFLGVVPNEQVLPMTLESHAVLAMLDPAHHISKVGISNKMFEAMVTGRPCIVTEGLLMAEIVEREDCGLIVPYTNPGFRGALERLRDEPDLAERLGRHGLEAAKREYNWGAEQTRLVHVYEKLAGRS
jgi:glycosyltransferase involved in cell wall biosynthesis